MEPFVLLHNRENNSEDRHDQNRHEAQPDENPQDERHLFGVSLVEIVPVSVPEIAVFSCTLIGRLSDGCSVTVGMRTAAVTV